MLKLNILNEKMKYFGGLGAVETGSGTRPANKSISPPFGQAFFGGHFGIFSVFVAGVFLVHFQGRSFSSLWAIWEPKGSKN